MKSSNSVSRKRKVSRDSDSDSPSEKIPADSIDVQSSSSIQNEDSLYTIEWEKLDGEASIWPFLAIQGPYHHIFSHLGNTVIKNRLFCKLLHEIASKIHENSLKFRDNDLPVLLNEVTGKKQLDVKIVIDIVIKMCQQVLHSDKNPAVFANVPGVLRQFRSLFAKETVTIEYNTFEGLIECVKDFCVDRCFSATPEQLRQARNAIVRYIFDLSLDLIVWITKRKTDRTKILIEKVIKDPFICDIQEAFTTLKWLIVSARLEDVSTSLMEQNNYKSSFWVSILSDDPKHLLEVVFGYGLIQVLPPKAIGFFKDWLSNIKSKIVPMLKENVLKKRIVKMMSGRLHEKMSLGDARVQKCLAEVGIKIFNQKNFEIFNKPWQGFTLNLIETVRGEAFDGDLDCEKLVERIRRMTHSSVHERINSFFPDSPDGHTMISHVLINLLRFVLCFLLNTIRHVFHFDPNTFKVYYDGKFEGDEEKLIFENEKHRSSKEPKKELSAEKMIKLEPQDHPNPPKDPVQVCQQGSSTQKVPVVQEKDSTDFIEDIPRKWQKGYKLLVKWNQELETEMKRVEAAISKFD